jgi:hypothetical protein
MVKQKIKTKKINKKIITDDDEIDMDAPVKIHTQFNYILLIGGIVITIGGLYMTMTNQASSSIPPGGRFGGGTQTQTISGPVLLFFGIASLIFLLLIILNRI